SLVSFNIDAFGSFGKAQGDNAPVSKQAAFAYGAALNWLLSRGSGRNFRVGDTTTVFWAEETGTGEVVADAAETMMSLNFSSLQDADAAAQSDIAEKLDKMAKGRPLAEIDPRLDAGTRMCVLGLSPNNARLAVRFWFVETFGKLAENFASHYRDLAIEPNTFKQPPQVWSLLYETAAQRKEKNIPPRLGGEIMRAVLTGARYPHTLLTAIIGRIRADKTVNGPRAAMCKAVINRDLRLSTTGKSKAENKEIPVALDETNVNTAYLLGRLFSLYEEAEAGVAKRNATIRDRYFGAASATPARVYPILMRGYGHNISKLGKGERAGQAVNIEKAVTGVIGHLTDVLPRTLALEDQGRFVVGYYHQQQQRFTKKTTDTSSPKSE
ncbi:MAG: type I-C CRISPR-associated protein Cas8c/Csd1, partial [Hyphomicrobiales bacterium]